MYADTPEQLLERLDTIYTRLRAHGLKAQASECVLFKSTIDFLGHTESAEGIETQTENCSNQGLAHSSLPLGRKSLLWVG